MSKTTSVERLTGLDLNLLVALDAILSAQSVTRASELLGVSQPSVSVALRKLRVHFDDELLSRSGNTWGLTPVAMGMRDHVQASLESVRDVFFHSSSFDAATTTREFVIRGSDHIAATVGVDVIAQARVDAPLAGFRFMCPSGDGWEEEMRSLEHCDGALLPSGVLPGFPNQRVIRDHWVCLVSADRHAADDALTLQQLGTMPFVVTHQSRRQPHPAISQLRMLGLDLSIDSVVDSFLALPWFIAGSDRVALVPSQLAPKLTAGGSVRALPCPHDAVRLSVTLYWHPRHTDDPGHQWMRRQIARAGLANSDELGRTHLRASG